MAAFIGLIIGLIVVVYSDSVCGLFAVAAVLPLVGWGILFRRAENKDRELGRHTLVVESDGRVLYRGDLLARPGSVVSVVVRGVVSTRYDGDDIAIEISSYLLFLQSSHGRTELPRPYFSEFTLREEAEGLADKVGQLLGVPVIHEGKPLDDG